MDDSLFYKPLLEELAGKQTYCSMGVDTCDKDCPDYCLTRKTDNVVGVLLCKTMWDEKEFKQEVENLAKYFNLKTMENKDIVKDKIKEIIKKNSGETNIYGFKAIEIRRGELDKIADEIIKLFAIHDVSDNCIQFAIWVQDNYSQNEKQGSKNPLPKGKMRKDFTDDIFTMVEIWEHYSLSLTACKCNVASLPYVEPIFDFCPRCGGKRTG